MMSQRTTPLFSSLKERYNPYSQTFVLKIDDILSVELNPLLRSALQLYIYHRSVEKVITYLQQNNYTVDEQEVRDWLGQLYIELEHERTDPFHDVSVHYNRIMDFSLFNPLLGLLVPFRLIILLLSVLGIVYFWMLSPAGYSILAEVLYHRGILYHHIIWLFPAFYFSRLLFTPIHEFGHNFWYYMYTGRSGVFYINIKGFIRFQGITDLPDTLFLPKRYQRALVSLGGIWAELVFLTLLVQVIPSQFQYAVLAITFRVLLSVFWNFNLLSTGSDGHRLVSDIIGFPTLGESMQEYLSSLVTKRQLLKSLYINRVIHTVQTFFIGSLLFVSVMFLLQLNYFSRILLTLWLFTLSQPDLFSNIIIILLVMFSYLYLLDFVVVGVRRINYLLKLLKIRRKLTKKNKVSKS